MEDTVKSDPLSPTDTFVRRHIGPSDAEVAAMLEAVGFDSLDALARAVVPESIQLAEAMTLTGVDENAGENETLQRLRAVASKNTVAKSFIGCGYHGTITPPVILRNILENPGWYTQYTPYQAEISQGRLEALLNFQTMIADLTALPLANASLLDEATAAAEAMSMALGITRNAKSGFFVASDCHPQTINVVETRAEPIGVNVTVGSPIEADFENGDIFAILLQYPGTDGRIVDYTSVVEKAHAAGALVICACDLLALTLIKPPGEWGADIAIGSAQRFGVPMGGGGPHAAFMSTHEKYARKMPGRIVGVSKDSDGNAAYRLAIQTREQHIKRDRATSNICTAQVLLAIMAGMYAVYHGPEGLRKIAERVRSLTLSLVEGLWALGYEITAGEADAEFFDTICVQVKPGAVSAAISEASEKGMNFRSFSNDQYVGISLDESTTADDVRAIWEIFANEGQVDFTVEQMLDEKSIVWDSNYSSNVVRKSDYLQHPVFNSYHAEHEMLRYLNRLQAKDLSLTTSMIPLGSCTMKLNATSEMIPVTWPEFANIHPFAPKEQLAGYAQMFDELETWLAEITGFAAVSLQPNAGSQGEYAGLLAIRGYHRANGDEGRDICLIPTSAHGTNPASAVMCGMKVVGVACDKHGNIDVDDLAAKAAEHKDKLAALMITYPSTHGVFEPEVRAIVDAIHANGGLVYMDGANMNAQVGLTSPGEIGADVCHLNLHKTFCIPHGGGGPGMGPIGVNEKLAPYLPGSPLRDDDAPVGPVSAAPFGSAAILPISWMYIAMMGAQGLTRATQVAILNANYMAKRLAGHYDVLYTGVGGLCAHEFILDCRELPKRANVSVEDIAKRLMDYGFHAPTMSFPVSGTLMIEPTESESRAELDRLCDALIAIREEIASIERGDMDRDDNPLHHAPHTAAACTADEWPHTYSRQLAAYPAPWTRAFKYWPPVSRIDNPWGDRNLMCSCPSVEEVATD